MIKKLFIIAESSANLFTYAPLEKKSDEIQDQLITGFIMANVSFSEAVIGKGINTVRVGGDRLMFFKHKSGLTIAAIVDVRDDVKLLKKVMTEIIENFLVLFERELSMKNIDFSRTDKAKDFKYFIDDLCQKYITSRDTWKTGIAVTAGVLISFIFIQLFFFQVLQIFDSMVNIISSAPTENGIQAFGLMCLITQLLIFISIAPSSLVSGLIAADRKYGKMAAFIHYFILVILETIYYLANPFYVYLNPTTVYFIIITILVFSPSISLVLYLLGDLGGYIMTRFKLYPLEELKMRALKTINLKEEII
ncbi:MAG: hypothetical protein ACTSRP_11900 [Candidatus Helarchaeota archaeon]